MNPGPTRTVDHKARNGALLFSAASLVTLLGLLLPHQAGVDETGLVIVVTGASTLALVLIAAGARLNDVGYSVAIGLGTVLISLAAVSNGERSGGAAGYDELYYLWVVFYAAYYLRRRTLALQVLLIAVSYAVTLALIDPGPIATSRWLTVIGLVAGGAFVVRLLTEHVEQLVAELDTAARTDRLTGLANRRALEPATTKTRPASSTSAWCGSRRPSRVTSEAAPNSSAPLRAWWLSVLVASGSIRPLSASGRARVMSAPARCAQCESLTTI